MSVGPNATMTSDMAGILPKPVAAKIIRKAYGESLVGRLSGTTAMPITGTSIAFATETPVAGIVGEGEAKPVIKQGLAVKTATPIKAAALVYWSMEARQANLAGYLGMLEETAGDAIKAAIDMAVLHGLDASKNTKIAGVEYVAQTDKVITLGADKAIAGNILKGYQQVVDADGDFTGFAADKRLRTKLMGAVDQHGQPIYSSGGRGGADLKDPMGDLLGLPVTYGNAVSGRLGVVPDTNIRLIGGAFEDNIKFGYVEQINFRRSSEATIVDGGKEIHLFQHNMEAFIIEAQFGWIIKDPNDFVVYKVAGSSTPTGPTGP